ncbi:DUF2254 domain-containing protein [Frigoribacterium sp. VKM Ac-2836]|uniref:DUF2254 domain-containing protein n=1 Tax=Frigoribacterium sp. VKM Ac-2836 TaxID=2739014 RepID=UPI001565C112|nr:DUF2254 domain-containing protein [Frigoribacterium sp. VKM Ac-2836]NRD25111.1 DUF2254 domain-containing protein [Frigoribacterium sp. VKM Ac-2836]
MLSLTRVRESFWFLPAVFGLAALVVAEVLVTIDRALPTTVTEGLPLLGALSASGGRSLLSGIGTSMLTVAGTSFSITISVLATTSSTYGPRLVRNFMADRANQFVLATFTSTFLYCIVVMRTVHTEVDDTSAFVPVIAVHVAVLLSVFDVGVLVFFIHHIAGSVQITSLQARVLDDLRAATDDVYPTSPADDVSQEARVRSSTDGRLPTEAAVVRADADGYVQTIAWEGLRRVAVHEGLVVEVVAMPGRYVIVGDPLVVTSASPGSDTARALRRTVTLGPARTPHQDVGFALQQLVEIAVRGLASGSNDPYTAVSALDMSAGVLVPLWRRGERVTALLDDRGAEVVLVSWPTVDELVDSLFDTVRTYAQDHPAVLAAALRLVARLDEVASPARVGRLVDHETAVRGALGG